MEREEADGFVMRKKKPPRIECPTEFLNMLIVGINYVATRNSHFFPLPFNLSDCHVIVGRVQNETNEENSVQRQPIV